MYATAFTVIAYVAFANCLELPVVLPPVVINATADNNCPAADVLKQARDGIKSAVHHSILQNTTLFPCSCGQGGWRIAYLNMSDPNQQCPSDWRLITSPQRACTQATSGWYACDSATYPSNGRSYSRVCGRINAYQRADTKAFENTYRNNPGLEGPYMDGISVTHGAAGSRQHIWSFVNALHETDPNYNPRLNCACTNTNIEWPYQVPSFVGNNYFCDTGNPGPGYSFTTLYPNDPLWDGEGCGPNNACCKFNNPPWFCTSLPEPTTDNLEVRMCFIHHNVASHVTLIEIYVN